MTPPSHPDARAIWTGFAAELAPWVSVWQDLLARHVPTAECLCAAPQCATPGRGTARTPWPCSTYAIADAARRHHLPDSGRPWTG